MADINLGAGTIQRSVTSLNENSSQVSKELNELENLINALTTDYNSTAAQAFVNKYNEVKLELKQIPTAISDIAEKIMTIKTEMFKLQDDLASQMK